MIYVCILIYIGTLVSNGQESNIIAIIFEIMLRKRAFNKIKWTLTELHFSSDKVGGAMDKFAWRSVVVTGRWGKKLTTLEVHVLFILFILYYLVPSTSKQFEVT